MTTAELAQQVQYLIDRAAIGDTLLAFARAIDTRDWEGYQDLFLDDGVLELPFTNPDGTTAGHAGRSGMADFVRHGFRRFTATNHLSANHQITIDGDRASTVSYCQCVHRLSDDPAEVWELGGWYKCSLERSGQAWKFSKVRLEMVWQSGFPGVE